MSTPAPRGARIRPHLHARPGSPFKSVLKPSSGPSIRARLGLVPLYLLAPFASLTPVASFAADAAASSTAPSVHAADAAADATLPTVTVNASSGGTGAAAVRAVDPNLPATVETVTPQQFDNWNVVNTEDALKYLPNLAVRKRFVGDLNSIIAVRGTSNTQSARGLVYADGLLLSNLLGNSYSFPPRWSMLFPD